MASLTDSGMIDMTTDLPGSGSAARNVFRCRIVTS
jgi:hypothetical protein